MKLPIYACSILSVIVAVLFLRCSPGGGTIETTNGITGSVRNRDNTPASGAIVTLFPVNHNPLTDGDELYIDTTDATGKYRFGRIGTGQYTILARSSDTATCLIVRNIDVADDSVTSVPPDTLDRPGSIITGFSKGVAFDSSGYVYLPGTDIFSFVGNDGTACLDNVPAGTFTEVMFAVVSSEQRNILRDDISLTPDDTVFIVNPLWSHSCRIVLNTAASGAGITEDIHDFPVLIRLNSTNFDFSPAATDGSDLLFSRNGNELLPFEIERWDATAGQAELWVKVDTIRGNNSTQSITMYWGNPDATGSSSGEAVFDTAAGFQGVWHLNETDGDSALDATANRYNGGAPATSRPQTGEGVIGKCRVFDGVDDFLTMPNTAAGNLDFPENGTYTVGAWVYLESFDNLSHCIVTKGFNQYFLRSTYLSELTITNEPMWEFVEFSETDKWQICTTPATSGHWVYLAGVSDGNRQFLFCNGEMVDSSLFKWPNDQEQRNTSHDLFIGRFFEEVTLPPMGSKVIGYNHFKGSIDEVRITSTAQRPNWVKLCYMNQRTDDRLVVFE